MHSCLDQERPEDRDVEQDFVATVLRRFETSMKISRTAISTLAGGDRLLRKGGSPFS